jgi:hypothetical protein
MVTVFISYSHQDEDYRKELEKHLKILQRQGVIDVWHDRRIEAGQELDLEISNQLESADIILLMVSSNFLASDYCYEREMQRAMERHNAGTARVIPIIVHPCNWHRTPFGGLLATPTDGKPISTFSNAHVAYDEVSRAIETAAHSIQSKATNANTSPPRSSLQVSQVPAPSNKLRIRRTFTDLEKDNFLHDAFDGISSFFKQAMLDLQNQHPEVKTVYRQIDANRFQGSIYVSGDEAAKATIWLGGGLSSRTDGIYYSSGHTTTSNSYNESISIDTDGYELSLKPLGLAFYSSGANKNQDAFAASEYLWGIFTQPLR